MTQLGKDIHADLLLTGTVQATDDGIIVHAEAIDTRRGEQVWSQEFKRPAGDLIGVQTAVVSDLSLHLAPALSKEIRVRLAASAPTNPEAYDYFILGSNYWQSGDASALPIAEQYFVRATELDSTLAGAWVALGAMRTDRYFRGDRGGQADLMEAEGMFRRALRLQPGMPAAERGLMRALGEKGTPGRYEECLNIAAAALERDPVGLASAYSNAGDTTRLLEQLEVVRRLAVKLSPESRGSPEVDLMGREEMLAEIYARTGRMGEARALLSRVSPEIDLVGQTGPDSVKLVPEPADPAITALHLTPECIALRTAQRARVDALYGRYQPIVAAALPHEPDVPGPRRRWPRDPVR